jgi:hypothetical protein
VFDSPAKQSSGYLLSNIEAAPRKQSKNKTRSRRAPVYRRHIKIGRLRLCDALDHFGEIFRWLRTRDGKTPAEDETGHALRAQRRFEKIFGEKQAANLRDILEELSSEAFRKAYRAKSTL